MTSCTGLYAGGMQPTKKIKPNTFDEQRINPNLDFAYYDKSYRILDVTKAVAEEDAERRAAIKEYEDHKIGFAKNIQFDGKRANKSKISSLYLRCFLSGVFSCRK